MLATQSSHLSWRDNLAHWLWRLLRIEPVPTPVMQPAYIAQPVSASTAIVLQPITDTNVNYIDVGRRFPIRADVHARAYRAARED